MRINEAVKDLFNKLNALINEQELKYFVKKGGSWRVADDLDLLFFRKEEFVDVIPRKRGDLLQSNTWEGYILAVFLTNKNGKDMRYIANQLSDAEKMSPVWLRENSNME